MNVGIGCNTFPFRDYAGCETTCRDTINELSSSKNTLSSPINE